MESPAPARVENFICARPAAFSGAARSDWYKSHRLHRRDRCTRQAWRPAPPPPRGARASAAGAHTHRRCCCSRPWRCCWPPRRPAASSSSTACCSRAAVRGGASCAGAPAGPPAAASARRRSRTPRPPPPLTRTSPPRAPSRKPGRRLTSWIGGPGTASIISANDAGARGQRRRAPGLSAARVEPTGTCASPARQPQPTACSPLRPLTSARPRALAPPVGAIEEAVSADNFGATYAATQARGLMGPGGGRHSRLAGRLRARLGAEAGRRVGRLHAAATTAATPHPPITHVAPYTCTRRPHPPNPHPSPPRSSLARRPAGGIRRRRRRGVP
jgi:hypothetical protein